MTTQRALALLLWLACSSCTSSAIVGRLAEVDAEVPEEVELDASRPAELRDVVRIDAVDDAYVEPPDASGEAGAPDASGEASAPEASLGCVDDRGCPAGRRCTRGTCVQCIVDDDCAGQEEPRCDERGRCVECRSSAECTRSNQVCAPWGECEFTCSRDSQCLANLRCNANFMVCLECMQDADCTGSDQFCDEGVCTRCTGNPDCPN